MRKVNPWQTVLMIVLLIFITAHAQIEVGKPAPDFNVPDTAGTLHSLSSFSGSVILLNFFTTWCEPCKIEVPQLQDSIWTQYDQSKVAVIGMDFMENTKLLTDYIKEYGLSYHFLQDTSGEVFQNYGFRGFPSNVIIDQDGIVAYASSGFNIQLFTEIIDSLLGVSGINDDFQDGNSIPHELELLSTYPNPFNPNTIIRYRQFTSGEIHLRVSDMRGRVIMEKSLQNPAGLQQIQINFSNYSSGLYVFTLQKGKAVKSGRLMLLK